jgi:hypothetical protein
MDLYHIPLFKSTIFEGEVAMFLWFSDGFLMVFYWFSNGFLMVFLSLPLHFYCVEELETQLDQLGEVSLGPPHPCRAWLGDLETWENLGEFGRPGDRRPPWRPRLTGKSGETT